MNDLNIIKQLKQEIGRKLQKQKEITEFEHTGYILNKEKQVTWLNLHEFEIGYVPNTIFKLKELSVLDLSGNQLKFSSEIWRCANQR